MSILSLCFIPTFVLLGLGLGFAWLFCTPVRDEALDDFRGSVRDMIIPMAGATIGFGVGLLIYWLVWL